MKLLITGAGGFLGRHVVAAAVARGHQVRAMLRPAANKGVSAGWQEHPAVEVVYGDLRAPRGLEPLLAGVDAIIHLAAAKAGDLYEQFGGTVLATENLLNLLPCNGVKRLVLTVSFSVY